MSDLKLFRVGAGGVQAIPGTSVAVEKTLQTLIEGHSESFLGVRFLASEHMTGSDYKGRIDTLGIDENNSPVIIEYKRALNENVINQGLFYLNWLMNHQKDFAWLVLKRFGVEVAESIDWNTPRLVCIAGDFTKYDEHAIQQMPRNIERIRYRRYGDDLLLLERRRPRRVSRAGKLLELLHHRLVVVRRHQGKPLPIASRRRRATFRIDTRSFVTRCSRLVTTCRRRCARTMWHSVESRISHAWRSTHFSNGSSST